MKNNAGFTLIEVLVALAILAIALTAIVKSTSQNIRDNIYLQNKTIANWVGMQIINEARVGLLKLPEAPGTIEKETNMLNQMWTWQAHLENTNNQHIKRVIVEVHNKLTDNKLADLESYIYAP